MGFREDLHKLIGEQPTGDIHSVLNDMLVLLCSTLYLNANGSDEDMELDLVENIKSTWKDVTVKLKKDRDNENTERKTDK